MDLPSGEKVGPYSRRGSAASSLVRRFGAPDALTPEMSWSQTRPNASKAIVWPSGDWLGQRRIFACTGPDSTFSCHATRGATAISQCAVKGISRIAPDLTSSRTILPPFEKRIAWPSGVNA